MEKGSAAEEGTWHLPPPLVDTTQKLLGSEPWCLECEAVMDTTVILQL